MTATRPNTPDRKLTSGGTEIRLKRACNGCAQLIGDATEAEIEAVIDGYGLPDVRHECPNCGPALKTETAR